MDERELMYDWNRVDGLASAPRPIEFDDETLRDGLQSPSVTDPTIEDKIRILHLMEALGIQGADIGLPGAGPRARASVLALTREIARQGMKIRPNCAARTVLADIQPIFEITQETGIPLEVAAFLGSSPIRLYAEEWTEDLLVRRTEEAVSFAVGLGLPVMFVTEDTVRARPEVIRRLYTTAIECGARRVCISDTVGHATPEGVRAVVRFMRQVVADTGEDVKVDWHGHRDRGLDVVNALAAAEAGADRLHGTALGIGERVGNTPMDLLLVNLRLLGWIENDLTRLPEYCQTVAEACHLPLPYNYPVVGADAFRTASGVHAAAVIKAERKGHAWLADRIYSGVPAGWFGREQGIEVGPLSGESNVIYWLGKRGIEPARDLVAAILEQAKRAERVLGADEIMAVVRERRERGTGGEDLAR